MRGSREKLPFYPDDWNSFLENMFLYHLGDLKNPKLHAPCDLLRHNWCFFFTELPPPAWSGQQGRVSVPWVEGPGSRSGNAAESKWGSLTSPRDPAGRPHAPVLPFPEPPEHHQTPGRMGPELGEWRPVLPSKVCLVKAMLFPVVMCGCESWSIKKAECQRIDAFELWCWRRLMRVPWTARRSNQSILKEISPEYSLEGLMLKLPYFGHLM